MKCNTKKITMDTIKLEGQEFLTSKKMLHILDRIQQDREIVKDRKFNFMYINLYQLIYIGLGMN